MAEVQDWSYAGPEDRELEELEGPWEYATFDKDVGLQAHELWGQLTADLRPLPVDRFGWTEPEEDALRGLGSFDRLADLLVPPASTPDRNRREYRELLRSFRQALPFSDAERQWITDGQREGMSGFWGIQTGGREVLNTLEVELVSNGVKRVVHGRDLLQRWWFWRRELGAYSGGDGLTQARESLAGIATLLNPQLSYPALRHDVTAANDKESAVALGGMEA